ncbi:MAG: hypothetical protein A4E38_01770 [Methanoregulaceae archaeon PtaB.Bin108]|nr:MAG: hypothetical protein A4E38_01770 [Methanoregulaceae archaeon PtaB.Bin108]
MSAFVLDDELALVDLFLVDRVGVNTKLVGDHPAGEDWAHRSSTVDADHDDVVEVDLLALGKFVERHRIAALHRDTEFHGLGAIKEFLDKLRKEEGSAVERSSRTCDIFRVGDKHRLSIVEIGPLGDGKDGIDGL